MSSSSSVNTLQRLVEQLKLEAGVERIRPVKVINSSGARLKYRHRHKCLSSSCRASAVLYAERLQRCFACWSSGWKQPISRAQVLRVALKTGKVF